ncbi:MAG: type 4a pilus biogenesis protein PilO [Myxococcales bacterium]|nr:type 4a pilus biogenesis protein PilO [Myxococcales bacterium]
MDIPEQLQEKLESFARLSKVVRVGMLVSAIALLVGGYYFGIYQQANAELSQLKAKELSLQRRLSEVRSVAANLKAFEKELEALEERFTLALRSLPNEKQMEVLLTDINNLGKTVGVEIKSFKRQPEKLHDFYAEVPLAIELEGNFHDIARFFDRMAKLSRIVNMDEIKMHVASEDADGTVVTVSGTAVTYRFLEQV